jgi:hypothetical protein
LNSNEDDKYSNITLHGKRQTATIQKSQQWRFKLPLNAKCGGWESDKK